MIERVVKYGEPVTRVCQDYQISRPNFYKWLKRYQKASADKKLEAVIDKKPEVERYYRQTPEKYEEAVLSVVAQYPQLGIERIVQVLPRIAHKPIVGYHGVQNILRRHDLNTYEKRLAYAQSQITPVIRLVGAGEQAFAKLFALPIEARKKLVKLVSTSALVCFLTIVGLGALGYFGTLLGEAPTAGTRIGFVFASIALGVGSFFFIYSMKYYLTLALVLSFSRRSLEEQRETYGRSAGSGWLKRIFGLNGNGNGNGNGLWPFKNYSNSNNNGNGNSNGNGGMRAGGLQPNLDHIKLKRFPFFSIHLPFYNEKKVAERIINACMGMDYPKNSEGRPNYEVIICDDSTDETVDIVLNYQKKLGKVTKYIGKDGEAVTVVKPRGKPILKVLHRTTRSGFKGGALSYALQNLDPQVEFICIFDADFIPYPDTLEQFAKYFKATGGWEEKKNFRAQGLMTMPYDTNEKVEIDKQTQRVLDQQVEKIRAKSNTAVVAGYQWHVLNKSENWVTRGVRTEYAGSYVIERPGQEILGAMKIIHGSVYCIRADVLKHFGWGISITEDYELTLRVYEKGFKVVFTPYVQAPSECVSTLKRLIRQRMRWAEGHSYNTRKQFLKLIFNPRLTLMEKLEFLYLTPYYLQATFFIIGTLSWLLSEAVFRTRLPFWTDLWGWSLVLTNFFSLPLVNAVGLFLEEAEEKDYLGLLSFVALCYLVVPFQAYAAVKGFLEPKEGTWFRTPKSGKITDIFTRGKFYRWVTGIIPGRRLAPTAATLANKVAPAYVYQKNVYVARATANNQFSNFKIKPKRLRWVSKLALVVLLIASSTILSFTKGVPESLATEGSAGHWYLSNNANGSSPLSGTSEWQLLDNTTDTDDSSSTYISTDAIAGFFKFKPGTSNSTAEGDATCANNEADEGGWIFYDAYEDNASVSSNDWTFKVYLSDNKKQSVGAMTACVYDVTITGESISSSTFRFQSDDTTDVWVNSAGQSVSWTETGAPGWTPTAGDYLYVEFFNNITTGGPQIYDMYFYTGGTYGNPDIVFSGTFQIPEKTVVLVAAAPFIPMVVMWMRKRKERLVTKV